MSEAIEAPPESAALVVLPKSELVFTPGGSATLLATIRERATAEAAKLDVTKPKDRDAIASLVWKLRRTKTAIDDAGKTLKSDYQIKITPIDAERWVAREGMDALIEEIDAPLTAFKMREELRLRGHETTLTEIERWSDVPEDWTADQITARIEELKSHPHLERQWEEYEAKAKAAVRNAYNALVAARVEAQEREVEAARLAAEAKDRAKAETLRLAQEQRAREERAAAEATRLAELRATEQARGAEQAAQALLDAAAAREKAQAEALAAAEARRIAQHRRAIAAIPERADYGTTETSAELGARLDWLLRQNPETFEEFADEAAAVLAAEVERTRTLLTAARTREDEAEAARVAEAEADQKRREDAAAEVARLAEQKRQEREAADKKAEDDRRAADEAHRASVHRAAAAAIVRVLDSVIADPVVARAAAKAVVTALAKRQVPQVTISY